MASLDVSISFPRKAEAVARWAAILYAFASVASALGSLTVFNSPVEVRQLSLSAFLLRTGVFTAGAVFMLICWIGLRRRTDRGILYGLVSHAAVAAGFLIGDSLLMAAGLVHGWTAWFLWKSLRG